MLNSFISSIVFCRLLFAKMQTEIWPCALFLEHQERHRGRRISPKSVCSSLSGDWTEPACPPMGGRDSWLFPDTNRCWLVHRGCWQVCCMCVHPALAGSDAIRGEHRADSFQLHFDWAVGSHAEQDTRRTMLLLSWCQCCSYPEFKCAVVQ